MWYRLKSSHVVCRAHAGALVETARRKGKDPRPMHLSAPV